MNITFTLVNINKIEVKSSSVGTNNSNHIIQGNSKIKTLYKTTGASNATEVKDKTQITATSALSWFFYVIGKTLLDKPSYSEYFLKFVPIGVYLLSGRSPPII